MIIRTFLDTGCFATKHWLRCTPFWTGVIFSSNALTMLMPETELETVANHTDQMSAIFPETNIF